VSDRHHHLDGVQPLAPGGVMPAGPWEPEPGAGDTKPSGAWTTGPEAPRWGLGDAIFGLALSLFGSILAAGVVLAITGAKKGDELSLAWLNVAQLGLWIPLVAVTVGAAHLKGNGVVRDFGFRVVPQDAVGILAGLASQWILLPLLYVPIFVLTNIDSNDLGKVAKDLSDRADDPFGVVMLVLLTGIAAPIIEELFYRGLLLRALERRWGPNVAVLGSGLVFGVIHFEPLQTLGLVAFGIVLGALAMKTGRLGTSILAHMAFNMVAIVSLLVAS
jgi:membrane protease YdiL (CAAX protease family)